MSGPDGSTESTPSSAAARERSRWARLGAALSSMIGIAFDAIPHLAFGVLGLVVLVKVVSAAENTIGAIIAAIFGGFIVLSGLTGMADYQGKSGVDAELGDLDGGDD